MAAANNTKKISFDLLYTIRETQLQHGLRSDDFGKYHNYLTGRIKTLRKQLKLSNPHKIVSSNKKKNESSAAAASSGAAATASSGPKQSNGTYVAPRELTEQNCPRDPRAITLLALMCERCWAESEELRHAATGPSDSNIMRRHNGNVTVLMRHSRSRLSRATQQTTKMMKVLEAVGDDALIAQGKAYTASINGRHAFTASDFATAKKHFLQARDLYHNMVITSKDGSPSQVLAIELRTECDDRIITCMRRLNEDTTTYKPAMQQGSSAAAAAKAGSAFGSLSWLGREIPLSNFQVQNSLRRFDGLEVFKSASTLIANASSVEDTNGTDGMSWYIFQQQSAFNKLQDNFDRAVGTLNDAQDAVAADLNTAASTASAATVAAASNQNTNELRLTQHCLKFRSLMCVATRAYLAAWSLGARFLLSSELLLNPTSSSSASANSNATSVSRLPSKRLVNLNAAVTQTLTTKELPFTLQHVVSPIEVVKLFDNVLATIEEALLLPGVDGDDSVEAMKEMIRADRLFFIARGWHVAATAAASSGGDATDDNNNNNNSEALSRSVSALTHCEKVLASIEKKHPDSGKALEEWKENFGFPCPFLSVPRSLVARRAASSRTTAAALDAVPELNQMISSSSSLLVGDEATQQQANAGKKKQQQKGNQGLSQRLLARAEGQQQQQASSSVRHVASDKLQEFIACSAFTEFPPDFQAAPCKPAFVDIAGTYGEDYLAELDDDDEHQQDQAPKSTKPNNNNNNHNNTSTGSKPAASQQQQEETKPQGGGGWLGWLRGS